MPRFRGVIFDLDGTLLDTLADIATSMNAALHAHGLPTYALEDYPRLVGGGLRQMIADATPEKRRSDALTDELVSGFFREYALHATDETQPYEGCVEALGALHRAGVQLAVLSNKPDRFTRELTAQLLPSIPFVAVMGQTDRFPTKPAPDSALYIVDMMGLRPQDVAYAGDSDVDIITAHNAGLAAIGASWGFRGVDELRSAGADFIAASMRELAEWVDSADRRT